MLSPIIKNMRNFRRRASIVNREWKPDHMIKEGTRALDGFLYCAEAF